MTGNAFLCGWCAAGSVMPDVQAARSAMLSCFSSWQASWFESEHLNIAAQGDVASLAGKVDVAIIGAPYWKNSDSEKQANEQGHALFITKKYLDHGMSFLDTLAGRFSIVIFDHARKQLVLCIDRIGQQHLYYAQTDNGVVFASRADAVVNHPSVTKKISHQGIYNYFYFHAMPSPGTIFEGVNKLENGQYLIFQDGNKHSHRYWEPMFSEQQQGTIEALTEEMLPIIERAVSRSIPSNSSPHSTGAFLSGGLDSSTVSGILSKVTCGQARTFSIGFDAKGYDEMSYARIASRHFKTQQHEYYVTPEDVVAEVKNIAKYLDEPFGNSSALPAYFCARMAKEQGVERLLAGDGGDEIFAGNERYAKQGVFESYTKVPAMFRSLLLEPLFFHNPITQHIPGLMKIHSYIRQAKIPLPDRLETYNYLHRHAASEIFSEEFLDGIDHQQPIKTLRDSYQQPNDATALNRMLWMDWKKTLHDNDLVKVNRMCELAGVGVDYPLLDDELIDFSCRIPSSMKINNGKLRWFYKEAVSGFLPQEIIEKTKQGFGLPFGVWTSEHAGLRSLAYSSLESIKKRGIFKVSFIEQTIQMHKGVHAKFYGELVWILMMLEFWLDEHGK
ncbi:MAG: asparagine synthase-related protein [Gammaproteobacteria bacterium]|nr:asparagine synthase-related protein [Gammaproteobacteria bacterium]